MPVKAHAERTQQYCIVPASTRRVVFVLTRGTHPVPTVVTSSLRLSGAWLFPHSVHERGNGCAVETLNYQTLGLLAPYACLGPYTPAPKSHRAVVRCDRVRRGHQHGAAHI